MNLLGNHTWFPLTGLPGPVASDVLPTVRLDLAGFLSVGFREGRLEGLGPGQASKRVQPLGPKVSGAI